MGVKVRKRSLGRRQPFCKFKILANDIFWPDHAPFIRRMLVTSRVPIRNKEFGSRYDEIMMKPMMKYMMKPMM